VRTASVIALLAALFGVALGTAFSLAYDQAVSDELALLFGLVGLALAGGVYGVWRLLRGKGAE